MMEAIFVALEGTAFATALRQSTWVYPLVNAGHVLGVALLLGAILPLDLRLLGAWQRFPVKPLLHVLRKTAATGLALAVTCGLLLFVTRASEYVASPFFRIKMAVVLLGLLNALIAGRVLQRTDVQNLPLDAVLPPSLRIAALISAASWLTALVLGRLLGYF